MNKLQAMSENKRLRDANERLEAENKRLQTALDSALAALSKRIVGLREENKRLSSSLEDWKEVTNELTLALDDLEPDWRTNEFWGAVLATQIEFAKNGCPDEAPVQRNEFFDVRMPNRDTPGKQRNDLSGLLATLKGIIQNKRDDFPALRIIVEGVE